jgi:hypothetical protein
MSLRSMRMDGRRYLEQAGEAIACHTIATSGYECNEQWQQAWYKTAVTLGGTVSCRLMIRSATSARRIFSAGGE